MNRYLFTVLMFAVSLPLLAQNSSHSQLDLVGMPDLWVDQSMSQQWVVREELLQANFCSVEEGNVTPGLRKLLRFTVTTPNTGDADLFVGDPNEHVAADDGLFEFATCHGHYHFQHYALYELVDPRNGFVWRAAKRGFCMLDTDPVPTANGNEQPRAAQFRNCGSTSHAGYQGISHGWADTYRFYLGGQYFVLDGGDGQTPVPPGEYIIRITVNPAYAPNKKGNCPLVKDPFGTCRQFAESNYNNNVGEVRITIPAHPGREGIGPLKNEKPLGYEPAEH